MRLFNIRDSWTIDGMLVDRIPAGHVVPIKSMDAYYETVPFGSPLYVDLQAPCQFERCVLLQQSDTGYKFVIVPMSKDVAINEEHN